MSIEAKVNAVEEIFTLRKALSNERWEISSIATESGRKDLVIAGSKKFDVYAVFESGKEYAIGEELKLPREFFDEAGAFLIAGHDYAFKTFNDQKGNRISPEDIFDARKIQDAEDEEARYAALAKQEEYEERQPAANAIHAGLSEIPDQNKGDYLAARQIAVKVFSDIVNKDMSYFDASYVDPISDRLHYERQIIKELLSDVGAGADTKLQSEYLKELCAGFSGQLSENILEAYGWDKEGLNNTLLKRSEQIFAGEQQMKDSKNTENKQTKEPGYDVGFITNRLEYLKNPTTWQSDMWDISAEEVKAEIAALEKSLQGAKAEAQSEEYENIDDYEVSLSDVDRHERQHAFAEWSYDKLSDADKAAYDKKEAAYHKQKIAELDGEEMG